MPQSPQQQLLYRARQLWSSYPYAQAMEMAERENQELIPLIDKMEAGKIRSRMKGREGVPTGGESFMGGWNHPSYGVFRNVVPFAGRISNPATSYDQWARQSKLSPQDWINENPGKTYMDWQRFMKRFKQPSQGNWFQRALNPITRHLMAPR